MSAVEVMLAKHGRVEGGVGDNRIGLLSPLPGLVIHGGTEPTADAVGYHLSALRAWGHDFEFWVGLVQSVDTVETTTQMSYRDFGSPARVVEAAGTSSA